VETSMAGPDTARLDLPPRPRRDEDWIRRIIHALQQT
jgi:hypothetical protein